ncbi:TonB-dependent vitamin B12 receptor [soil metagenome]
MSAAFSILQPAAAQSALKETVVTATRTATRSDELVSEVVVIDRETIEKSAGRTLPEILARQAGLEFSSNGGRGKSSSVYIRGAESRHTILLIDGVRYGSATVGTPIWDNIPLSSIERIEVLKGPGSSLYGADGVGGVVQIFTRKGQQGFHPNAFVSLGSQSYTQAGGGFTGGTGAFTYALNLQATRDKGFSSANPGVPFGNYNADRDGFNQDAVNATLGYQVNTDWSISAGTLYSDGISRFDDGPGRDARSRLRSEVSRIGVEGRVLPGWKSQLRYASSTDVNNALVASFLPSNFKTTQNQWTWQNDIDTPWGTALAGFERLEQKVSSSTAYAVTQRDINSVFAGLMGNAGAHSWQFNLRRDDNTQFGGSSTGFAGYGYRITPAWRVNASYGTSFTAPSFNQLYFPAFGTPTLQPEKGRNLDLGVTWSEAGHSVKLVHFDNRIRGFIPSGPLPVNVPRARIDGWTLGYDGSFGALTLRASLDANDPRNELTGKKLPRRNSSQVILGADYAVREWTMGGTLLRAGERFDDTANAVRLAGYTTLDLNLGYAISQELKLQTSLTNIGNRQYETIKGYNQPGRAVVVSLRWQQ